MNLFLLSQFAHTQYTLINIFAIEEGLHRQFRHLPLHRFMLNSISNLWLDAVATIILSLAWSFQVMVCVCRIKKSQWWLFPFILSKIFNRSRCGSQCLMNCYHLHFLFQWLTQIGLVAFRFSLLRLESSPSQALIESLFSFCRVEKLDILPPAGSRKGLSEVFRPDNPQSLLAGAAGGIFPKPYTTACHDNFWFDLECTSFLTQPSGAYWKNLSLTKIFDQNWNSFCEPPCWSTCTYRWKIPVKLIERSYDAWSLNSNEQWKDKKWLVKA